MTFSVRTLGTSLATLTLASLLSLPAAAQPTTAPAHPHAAHQQHMLQRHAERLEHMKTLLQLQPQQHAAWERYVQAIQPQPRNTQATPNAEKRNLTTLERLDRTKQLREARTAAAEQRDHATRTFYAGLNTSQQKAFDALHTRMGPRDSHGKKAGHHRHMQPPHGLHHGHPGVQHHRAPQAPAAPIVP